MKVLITGIGGGLARQVAMRIHEAGHTVLGVDRRPWPDAPTGIEIFNTDVRKRPAEDVFRSHRPEAVVHMATVTHFTARREERYRINLGGTRAVLDHCHNYGAQHVVFVGRHTIYGAAGDAPLYRTEAEPPLAGTTFPDLADLVAADLYAGSALWRFPDLRTAVLRLVYTLGPSHRGTLANFLAGPRVPMVMGFDPLYHFMHEHDAADAIVLALKHRLNGVFNVAGPPPVPLSTLIEATGRKALPLPEFILPRFLGRFGLPFLPRGSLNHLKYPVVVDARPFAAATAFTPAFDEVRVMDGFRWS